jgi:hypothetical protein
VPVADYWYELKSWLLPRLRDLVLPLDALAIAGLAEPLRRENFPGWSARLQFHWRAVPIVATRSCQDLFAALSRSCHLTGPEFAATSQGWMWNFEQRPAEHQTVEFPVLTGVRLPVDVSADVAWLELAAGQPEVYSDSGALQSCSVLLQVQNFVQVPESDSLALRTNQFHHRHAHRGVARDAEPVVAAADCCLEIIESGRQSPK